MTTAALAAVLAICLAAASAAAADVEACETPMILVESDDRDLHRRACTVATQAMPVLEACHLRQKRPIIFRFSDAFASPYRVCLGLYHHGKDLIDLLTPAAFQPMHAQSEFCEGIAEDEHFDSIIVHELAHALVDQVSGGKLDYTVDQEYIAYALQLEIMDKPVRDGFLSSIGLSPPIETEGINDLIFLLSPSAFAASAWLHFSDQENGCALVDRLLRGKATFYSDPS